VISRLPRARARAAFLVLALLGPLACIRGTIPARELYRIATAPEDSATRPAPAIDAPPMPGSLGIAPYVTAGIYSEPSIAYRIGDAEYGTYPNREWALPLSQMLGVLTEEIVRRHPLTTEAAIYSPPSLRSQTYLWRGRVRRFEEVDRGKVVSAAVWVDAAILRTSDDSVLWSGSARRERVVSGKTMADVVTTLSVLATEAVEELVTDAVRSVQRRSAASAGGPE
jgi:ABC-type uncharacterized transport system auxiliary subunit